MQRAAKVAQLSMLAAAILGVIIFTGTKSDGEFGLITVVSVASVLAVFFVNRSGRQSRGEPQ
jgi:peptidoglycan/LPS O-acetylase OafA/YrhL